MKKLVHLTSLFLLLTCMTACTDQLTKDAKTIPSNEEIEQLDIDEYAKFIDSLEKEYEGKTVYHNFNRPDYSNAIDSLRANSIEEVYNAPVIATKANEAVFGPWGGNGGAAFDARMILYPSETWKKLTAIMIRHGAVIDAIQLYWINNLNQSSRSAVYGGAGGSQSWLYLAAGEYITGIRVYSGNKVDNLTFITNFNVYTYGGVGGANRTNLNFGASGLQMHGIYGRSGNKLDQLGVYCYPNNMFP